MTGCAVVCSCCIRWVEQEERDGLLLLLLPPPLLHPPAARCTCPLPRSEITALWQTDELRRRKPTPLDEARGGLYTIEQSLWSSLPKLLRRISSACAGAGRGGARGPASWPASARLHLRLAAPPDSTAGPRPSAAGTGVNHPTHPTTLPCHFTCSQKLP